MTNELDALRHTVDHLHDVVGRLSVDQIKGPAYPSEWTVAETLSHLGSGAVIFAHGLAVSVAGEEGDPGFNQSVWDEWNAKAPEEQAADALVADRTMLAALEALDEGQRATSSRSRWARWCSTSRPTWGYGCTSTCCTSGTSRSCSIPLRRSRSVAGRAWSALWE